jgi:transcriptional regulator with GAF, ATPase, and Fis domain
MWPKDFRKRLMLIIAVLVIMSGLIISQIVTHRYSTTLFQVAAAQGENVAQSLALDAADKILINDLVGLQNLLDDRVRSNPKIAYLFVVRDNRILTHTFTKGVPVDLINANVPSDNHQGHLKKIISHTNDRYMDFALPIFEGKAGILRLGLTEKPFRSQINQLWLQMSVMTLAILILALAIAHLLVKHMTRPLVQLTEQVEKVDEGHMDVNIEINAPDEIGRLSASFKQMLTRIQNYTLRITEYANRLEEKNRQLNRAYRQTRISFEIAREIGALTDLKEVCEFLINKLRSIVKCQNMVLITFSSKKSLLYSFSEKVVNTLEGTFVDATATLLADIKQMEFLDKSQLPYLFNELKPAEKIIVFPIHIKNHQLGAMYIGCPGDCECVTKELDIIELILNQTAGAVLRAVSYEDEVGDLKKRTELSFGFAGMIGKDPQLQIIFKLIEDVAPSDATVLIGGESGTGKEMVANAIHQKSPRKDRPFVVINCSAYPSTLLESELFGHEKGAFTGALTRKIGRFEQANGGTVFLDEIGEISPSAQIKLLRVLQSKKLERVGGQETLNVDIRILAATNKNLLREVKNGEFREDLFYRLNVIPISLPPLRNRRNDIPMLSRHFLERFSDMQDKKIIGFTSEAMRRLLDYSWPGNVRELENTIEHAAVLAKSDQVEVSDLPPPIRNFAGVFQDESDTTIGTIEENEIILLQNALEECNWNKKLAARRLGVSRATLYNKLKKYQIPKPTIQ